MDDWIISDELNLRVSHILGGAAASAMVVGGVIPYVPQYRQIKQTQDADGFSLLVCLTLLIANTLRILFWFSSRFELPLLVQSIVMNITMFLMIHLCVTVRRNNSILKSRERVFTDINQVDTTATNSHPDRAGNNVTARIKDDLRTAKPSPSIEEKKKRRRDSNKHYISDFDPKYFWAWTDFQSYLDFMLAVWFVGAIITYFMLPFTFFMESVGFMAVFIEAMLGAPQFLRNFKNKSTQGMSIMMVALWTVGDMFKTCYFIFRHAPMQFWICGTLQVSLDLAILFQVFWYRKNTEPRNVHRGD
ncbi:solute carrier family 66 member 2 isoform X1 [Sitodiplosis mosellana]|uniref:solute carrier family 66 member 2 isoform X1 n=2 Tax=Sitodiplosis mosellana TaxID=263140 RepID=UPI0024445733|nr:solute carrier family 66 member 2 isoform X1 [Sitodiplosis mosellana]